MTQPTTAFAQTVARYSSRLRDALRYGRSRTTAKQSSEYTRNVAKSILSSERAKSVEHVVALVVDLAQRGTLEDAEQIGNELIAIARLEHDAAHPSDTRLVLSRADATLLEQEAQGERETAETLMSLRPSESSLLRFLAADAKYNRARRVQREAVEREVVSA